MVNVQWSMFFHLFLKRLRVLLVMQQLHHHSHQRRMQHILESAEHVTLCQCERDIIQPEIPTGTVP